MFLFLFNDFIFMLNPFKSFTQLLFFHSKISILYPVAGWFCNNEIFIQLLTINPFCNLDLRSALLWWWWWRWWIVFVVWSTDERRLALFPARTIVRDPHHREYPARRAGFEPAQNLSSGLVEWSCAVVITTTPRCHKMVLYKNIIFIQKL